MAFYDDPDLQRYFLPSITPLQSDSILGTGSFSTVKKVQLAENFVQIAGSVAVNYVAITDH